MTRGSRRGERGTVFILAVLIIATLTGLTLGFSEESNIAVTLSSFSRDRFEAELLAGSGVHLTLGRLASDPDPEMDTLEEAWAEFDPPPLDGTEEVSVSGRITDESGKFNVNTLLNEEGGIDEERAELFLRLLENLGLERDLGVPLLDWLDRDGIERMNGAESYHYQGLDPPYRCADGPLSTIDELFLVKGMPRPKNAGGESEATVDVRDYLTVYSDGRININTAPPELLQSLSKEMDRGVGEAIASHRRTRPFQEPEALKQVPGVSEEMLSGVSPWLSVTSGAFTVESRATCRDAASEVRAVAVRKDGNLDIIYWRVE